jgi:hypothetical protein
MKVQHKQLLFSITVLLIFTFSMTGCGWNKQAWGLRSDEFMKTSIRYRSAVRWAEYDEAFSYVKLRDGEPSELDLDYLEKIEVTGYEIVKRTAVAKTKTTPEVAQVLVEIDFLRDASPSVNKIKREETWWFDEEAEKWYLDGNLPNFEKQRAE